MFDAEHQARVDQWNAWYAKVDKSRNGLPRPVLSVAQGLEIKAARAAGEGITELAKRFGTSRAHIRDILRLNHDYRLRGPAKLP